MPHPPQESSVPTRVLFLDDDLKRYERFRAQCSEAGFAGTLFHASSVRHAIALLEGERFDWAFLDHDLDGQVMVEPGPRTGLAVAQHIAAMERDKAPGRVVIHSYNPDGARAMLGALQAVRFRRATADYFDGPDFLRAVQEMARG